MNELTFTVAPYDIDDNTSSLGLTPVIDAVSLVQRVTAFEKRRRFSPAGGYGGLVPSNFRFGRLGTYYVGKQHNQWPRADHLWVLVCECGEAGCWPLTARVVATPETVTWTDFEQEHRRERDYTGFGPFVFARDQYDRAVECAARVVGADAG